MQQYISGVSNMTFPMATQPKSILGLKINRVSFDHLNFFPPIFQKKKKNTP